MKSTTVAETQNDIHEATSRDPVNITVYGNPVADLIIPVSPHASDVANVKALEQIGSLNHDGAIEFQPDTYITCYSEGQRCLFGPLNPNGQQSD